ncbi:hypothetical protein IWW50_006582, partial [Coemansia erecta]
MSAFHNDIFNRRSSSAFLGEFRQDNRSGVFAPPVMPKPLFGESNRRSSFGGPQQPSFGGPQQPSFGGPPQPSFSGQHTHFAYVEGCSICEEYVRRGVEICVHEHRVECCGAHRGCKCRRCIEVEVTVTRRADGERTRCATPNGGEYRARCATPSEGYRA